jgi:hypothetical protein
MPACILCNRCEKLSIGYIPQHDHKSYGKTPPLCPLPLPEQICAQNKCKRSGDKWRVNFLISLIHHKYLHCSCFKRNGVEILQ